MKWTKIIKSSNLTPEQFQHLKNEWSLDNVLLLELDSQEILEEMETDLKINFDEQRESISLDESDFQKVFGLSFEEFDKKVEERKINQIKEDFEDLKQDDIRELEQILDNLQTSYANRAVSNLIAELKNLQHDGSFDLGYSTEHILDREHKRIM